MSTFIIQTLTKNLDKFLKVFSFLCTFSVLLHLVKKYKVREALIKSGNDVKNKLFSIIFKQVGFL